MSDEFSVPVNFSPVNIFSVSDGNDSYNELLVQLKAKKPVIINPKLVVVPHWTMTDGKDRNRDQPTFFPLFIVKLGNDGMDTGETHFSGISICFLIITVLISLENFDLGITRSTPFSLNLSASSLSTCGKVSYAEDLAVLSLGVL